MRPLQVFFVLLACSGCGAAPTPATPLGKETTQVGLRQPERLVIGDVELHYVDSGGSGEPVLLVHGSLADYSYWQISNQIAPLAPHYRVIAYSRRYNHPNRNEFTDDHSAIVEAEDLGRFLDALGVDAVHLVGHSYGAYTALVFAMDHPQRVRSLILAEPPILPWLADIAGGDGIEADFMSNVWRPLEKAFRDGGDEAGLDFTARWYFQVPFNEIASEWQLLFRNNVREWRALAISRATFPKLDYDRVRAMRVRTLLLSGGKNSGGFNDLIDGRLEQLIPGAERVVIPGASHEMFLDFPGVTVQAMLEFVARPTQ